MLVIRKEQMDTLHAQSAERFVQRMALFLREQFAEETTTCSDEALRHRIRRELESAGGFGLISERALCSYLNLVTMYGEGFLERDENRWMVDYLTDPAVQDPDQRMHRLYLAVIKKLEQEADHQRILAEFYRPARPKAR